MSSQQLKSCSLYNFKQTIFIYLKPLFQKGDPFIWGSHLYRDASEIPWSYTL